MRPTVWVNFLAIFLLTAVACERTAAHGHPAKAPPSPPPSWTVESGWATTRDEAVQDALERAQAKVIEHLRAQNPPVAWTPPRDFIRDRLWTDLDAGDKAFQKFGWKDSVEAEANRRRVQEEVKVFDAPLGEMRRVAIRVTLGPSATEEIRERERAYQEAQQKERALTRQGVLARVLAGMIALLVVVACYLRLEDATKGYYTTLLRVVAVTFIAAVAAAILVIA